MSFRKLQIHSTQIYLEHKSEIRLKHIDAFSRFPVLVIENLNLNLITRHV